MVMVVELTGKCKCHPNHYWRDKKPKAIWPDTWLIHAPCDGKIVVKCKRYIVICSHGAHLYEETLSRTGGIISNRALIVVFNGYRR